MHEWKPKSHCLGKSGGWIVGLVFAPTIHHAAVEAVRQIGDVLQPVLTIKGDEALKDWGQSNVARGQHSIHEQITCFGKGCVQTATLGRASGHGNFTTSVVPFGVTKRT